MTIIRNKTNPNSAKMQKNDVYVARQKIPMGKKVAYWENLRSGHMVNIEIARHWLKEGIATPIHSYA